MGIKYPHPHLKTTFRFTRGKLSRALNDKDDPYTGSNEVGLFAKKYIEQPESTAALGPLPLPNAR